MLGLIVWLPLPMGSNRDWAVGILCASVFVLGAAWFLLYAHGKVELTLPFRKARVSFILMGLSVAWAFGQTIPIPVDWLVGLSSRVGRIYAEARAIDPDLVGALSINSYRTRLAAYTGLAYLLLFALVLLLARTRQRVRWLAYAVVASGVFQACYGSFMTLTGLEYGFLVEKDVNRGVATGTFVNRNHLAGYLEMSLAIGIGLLLGGRTGSPGANWRDWLRLVGDFLLSEKAVLRVGVVIMAIGLVLTRSRMGNVGFAVSLTVAGAVYLLVSRSSTMARGMALAIWGSILVVDMVIVGSYFGIEKVAQRLEGTTVEEAANRVDLFDYAKPYTRDFLLLGSGAGTFFAAFQPYSGPEVSKLADHAHNDYLEFLGEWGIFGFLPMAVVVIWSLTISVLGLRERHDPFLRGIAFAALMGLTALLVHSFVDFNLQIPANASLFVILLALAWVSRHLTEPKRMSRRRKAGHSVAASPVGEEPV
ncbi:MAG TPA: O-antigen ligase family protein [Methylococcus sp.]|nr:O-antigen ligase family protein [Methylococcus sp.]